MKILKSKTNPQAWNEKYDINDFSGTICHDECSVKWRMETSPENPLWIEVAYCIASNFFWRKETNAPKSRVKTEYEVPAKYEYIEYANILVIDRSFEDKNYLVINTLTGESFE